MPQIRHNTSCSEDNHFLCFFGINLARWQATLYQILNKRRIPSRFYLHSVLITKKGSFKNVSFYVFMLLPLLFLSMLFSGCLPKREVMEIVKQYNSAFNLKLDDYRVNELMTDPNNLDKSGNVLLQPFLSKLSA